MSLKCILVALVLLLLTSKRGDAQSMNLLCLQMQNQISINPNFASVSKANSPMHISVNEIKQLNFPVFPKNNGNSMRKVGKIMMIAGGAVYLIGGMTALTYGEGNLARGTAIAVTGAVAFATGVPLYFIGSE